jgi:hypothetical protein
MAAPAPVLLAAAVVIVGGKMLWMEYRRFG